MLTAPLALGSRLSQKLTAVGWSLPDVWHAITSSALRDRSRNDWLVIQPMIRKLLFRYFYQTDELRAEAQLQALEFDRTWSQAVAGSDRVAGIAECIWHEASALSVRDPGRLEQRLVTSAAALAGTLEPQDDYELDELRDMLAGRLRDDADLQHLLRDSAGVLDRLCQIVASA